MPFGNASVAIDLIDAESGDYDLVRGEMVIAVQERLKSLNFSDHHRKKDQLKLEFRNDDFALLENPIFAKGQKIAVTWGWPGKEKPGRRMIVTKVKGGSVITVTALDMTQLMDKEKKSKDWENVTDSEVIREIAGEHGYYGQYLHIEETTVRHDISQHFSTNARMLARLARRNGFEFYIDSSGLHWHERKLGIQPVRTLIYRTDPGVGDILDPPQFDANLSRGLSRVRVVARDPRTKEIWDLYGGPNNTQVEILGLEDEMGDPDDTEQGIRASRLTREDVLNLGILTKEEAQVQADAIYRESIKGKYKMKLNIIGDGRIGAKVLVDVYGIADSWDGLFYIKECEDHVEGGRFIQALSLEKSMLRKVPVSKKRKRGEKEKANANEASGEKQNENLKGSLRQKEIMIFDSYGDTVRANIWIDETGEQVGTEDRFETVALGIIPQRQSIEVNDWAQSVKPGTGQ